MSDFPVKASDIQDAENCWRKPRDLIALLERILRVTIPDAIFGRVWTGNAPPPADKTDYVWEKRSTDGKPLGFFRKWSGLFRPVWPSEPAGYIIAFSGAPSTVTAPFAICDGTNGTPDLRQMMRKAGSSTLGTAGGVDASGPITVTLDYGLMQNVGY